MSYRLSKPCTNIEYADFVVEHNQNNGRFIEETETSFYALEANEMMQNGVPILNPNYTSELAAKQRAIRIREIKETLEELDLKSIRAIREGGETDEGKAFLEVYQEEIETLRAEMTALEVAQ